MKKETSIICPKCGKDTGYTAEQLMFYVLTDNLLCPFCGEVIITVVKPLYEE